MDKIIIIDNNGIQDELEKFIIANKKHILFNSDMEYLSLKTNPILKEIIKNYEEKHKIKIQTKNGIWFFKSHEMIRMESKGENTVIYLTNKTHQLINENINQIEIQLKDLSLLRTHDNHLINVNYISQISNRDQNIKLNNGDIIPIDEQRKQQILISLEKFIEL